MSHLLLLPAVASAGSVSEHRAQRTAARSNNSRSSYEIHDRLRRSRPECIGTLNSAAIAARLRGIRLTGRHQNLRNAGLHASEPSLQQYCICFILFEDSNDRMRFLINHMTLIGHWNQHAFPSRAALSSRLRRITNHATG